jgi:hypothetical protein
MTMPTAGAGTTSGCDALMVSILSIRENWGDTTQEGTLYAAQGAFPKTSDDSVLRWGGAPGRVLMTRLKPGGPRRADTADS